MILRSSRQSRAATSVAPQPPQKREPGAFSWWHLPQMTTTRPFSPVWRRWDRARLIDLLRFVSYSRPSSYGGGGTVCTREGRSPRFCLAKLGKKRPLYSDEFEIYLAQVKSDLCRASAARGSNRSLKRTSRRWGSASGPTPRDGAPGQCGTLREPEAPQRAVDDVPGLDQRARYSAQVHRTWSTLSSPGTAPPPVPLNRDRTRHLGSAEPLRRVRRRGSSVGRWPRRCLLSLLKEDEADEVGVEPRTSLRH